MNRRSSLVILSTVLTLASMTIPASAGNPSPSADVSIEITDSPDPATLTDRITYVVTIANAGPSSVDAGFGGHLYGEFYTNVSPIGLEIRPPGAAWVSVTSSQGTCTSREEGGVNASGIRIYCELGTISSAADADVTIVATPAELGTLSLRGYAIDPSDDFWNYTQNDPDTSNNSSIEYTTVNAG